MFPNVCRRCVFAFVFLVVFGVCIAASGPAPAAIATVVLPPPDNDNPAGAQAISSLPFEVNANTIWATFDPTLEPVPYSCAYDWNINRTIWYKYTHLSDAEQLLSARLSQNDFEAVVAVYEGEPGPGSFPLTCRSYYYWNDGRTSFMAEPGKTYYIQVGGLWGGGGALHFTLEPAPDPVAQFNLYPGLPSMFDTVTFEDQSYDPAEYQPPSPLPGPSTIQTESWDFGDGTSVTQDYRPPWDSTYHNYASDGDYTVQLEVTTYDGRSGSTSRVVPVKTHDVAITKFSVPQSGSPGQTRSIVIGVSNKRYDEFVEVTLYKSQAPGWTVFVGKSIQFVPVRRATAPASSPSTTPSPTPMRRWARSRFVAHATIRASNDEYAYDLPDALPVDNDAIAVPTKVSDGGRWWWRQGQGRHRGGGHGGIHAGALPARHFRQLPGRQGSQCAEPIPACGRARIGKHSSCGHTSGDRGCDLLKNAMLSMS